MARALLLARLGVLVVLAAFAVVSVALTVGQAERPWLTLGFVAGVAAGLGMALVWYGVTLVTARAER